ncbi:hypothetical protein LOTGIDRAFT_159897 [Lottia gigantea]|uniref:Uncharacterized protein n=1 Tax=Lottia gigantea TaxID=225164 RepID=V4AHV0_LOTGI|nr:hypothetical protein LOTGIDRAFT_159897 [Lottia gigantea]ESO96482.1 hypothetical protein LOTGIDRAFT_159897 [Lottia gigantea]
MPKYVFVDLPDYNHIINPAVRKTFFHNKNIATIIGIISTKKTRGVNTRHNRLLAIHFESVVLKHYTLANEELPIINEVPPAEVAGIITGAVTVVILATVVAILCWRFPSCRSRTFWDKSIKKVLRKLYGKCKKQPKKEEKKHLIFGPLIRKRSRDEPPFVVPQIFVDYGSRRTSYASASDHVMLGALALDLRRSSGSSCGSRRTSYSSDIDRRGSGSSLCSRRTSYGSDYDRRGSGSSICSRRTSLISDPSDRRGSGASSRSSRKGSDGSRFDDTDVSFADFSDSETLELEEMVREQGVRASVAGIGIGAGRRISVDASGLEGRQIPPYRRSHSLAELKKPFRPIPTEGPWATISKFLDILRLDKI